MLVCDLPCADLVEELLPVLALGPLVRAGDIDHVGGCDYGRFYELGSQQI